MDDPEHAAYRNLTNRSFTPRAMRLIEDHIAELAEAYASGFARQLINTVAEQGECDFVHDLSVKLPMAAIFEMVGFPREDWEELFGIKEVEYGSDRELALAGLTPEERDVERRTANRGSSTEYLFGLRGRPQEGRDAQRLPRRRAAARRAGRAQAGGRRDLLLYQPAHRGRAGDDAQRHHGRRAGPAGASRGTR